MGTCTHGTVMCKLHFYRNLVCEQLCGGPHLYLFFWKKGRVVFICVSERCVVRSLMRKKDTKVVQTTTRMLVDGVSLINARAHVISNVFSNCRSFLLFNCIIVAVDVNHSIIILNLLFGFRNSFDDYSFFLRRSILT